MLFIIPSRWFKGGKNLDKFRSFMLARQDIVFIRHFDNSSDIFKNVQINGGVNYFLIDKKYKNDTLFNDNYITLNKYDVLITNSSYYNIINKALKYIELYGDITKYYMGRYFGIETNDKRLSALQKSPEYIKCIVSSTKGNIAYIHKSHIKKDYKFYKLIIPTLTTKFTSKLLNREEVFSGSFVGFRVNSKVEGENLDLYLRTNLIQFLIKLRKITNHNSKNVFKWVPLIDLSIRWTDEKLYNLFGLTKNEITCIEV